MLALARSEQLVKVLPENANLKKILHLMLNLETIEQIADEYVANPHLSSTQD